MNILLAEYSDEYPAEWYLVKLCSVNILNVGFAVVFSIPQFDYRYDVRTIIYQRIVL